MKKVALVFVLSVLLPSLVLAWLAVRSLRDQQFLLERQQSLLCQRATDSLAQTISDSLTQQQQDFAAQVEALVANQNTKTVTADFDDEIRRQWPLAEVGFCVTLSGKILSPSPNARPEAKKFHLDNSDFLGNREPVEVYWNASTARNDTQNATRSRQSSTFAQNGFVNGARLLGGFGGGGGSSGGGANPSHSDQNSTTSAATIYGRASDALTLKTQQKSESGHDLAVNTPTERLSDGAASKEIAPGNSPALDPVQSDQPNPVAAAGSVGDLQSQNSLNYKAPQTRKVSPQNATFAAAKDEMDDPQKNLSHVVPAEAEFAQLIGNENDGMLARFLQNKLKLMFWHRPGGHPDLIFGAQLNLTQIVNGLRNLIQTEPDLRDEICVALLDDNAKPVAVSRANFSANWKRPFVATEIGEALPHWEIAAYLINPAQLTQAAHTAKLTLGLFIALLVLAIGTGSWLIVRSLNLELKLARQKTDFVSNVSHELKTPLTSIRMFSELLAEGRVADTAKQRSYLQIITAEAARLTRLINNVLDFSRLESGEKKYHFQPCDLAEVARTTAETFRPHLETSGFQFICELPETKILLRGDADALSQIIVNLLSNAEKYAADTKDIRLQLAQKSSPLPHAEIKVCDRGSGVPRGSEEKIFEKFYRAHDSLASGIQGSGLGLTIARQIARAHGGDVIYEPRADGGSCFILRLPILTTNEN